MLFFQKLTILGIGLILGFLGHKAVESVITYRAYSRANFCLTELGIRAVNINMSPFQYAAEAYGCASDSDYTDLESSILWYPDLYCKINKKATICRH